MQYSAIALSFLVAAAHALLDCGGGRAPAKTTVPGCPMYAGTATVTPSFLPGYGADVATATAATTESTSAAAAAPDAPSMSIEGVFSEGLSIAPIETPPVSSYMSESATSSPHTFLTPATTITTLTPSTALTSSTVVVSTTLSPSTVEVTASVLSSTASALIPLITPSPPAGRGNGTTTTASNTVASTGGLNTTTSASVPFTGAANVLGSTNEVVGLAVGLVAGLAML